MTYSYRVDPMVGVIAKPQFTGLSGFYSGFKRVEPTEIVSTAVAGDVGLPSTGMIFPTNAGNPGFIAPMKIAIFSVLFWGRNSQIGYPVVILDMGYMVDLPLRMLAVDMEPSKPVSEMIAPKDSDTDVSIDYHTGLFTGEFGIPYFVRPWPCGRRIVVTFPPCENSRFGVVVEQALKFSLGYAFTNRGSDVRRGACDVRRGKR